MTHLPPGFPALMPYLSVPDPDGLKAFLDAVFAVEHGELHRDDAGRVVHGASRVEGVWIEYAGTDPQGFWPMTPAALHVYVPDVDATFARAIAAGAAALSEPAQMPYGERGASVRDGNGNHWHLATYNGRMG